MQFACHEALREVREGSRPCKEILGMQAFSCGSPFTKADLRLLPAMLQFDGAYAPLFKPGGTHLRMQSDYPNLHAGLRPCRPMLVVNDSIDLAGDQILLQTTLSFESWKVLLTPLTNYQ